VRQRLKKIERLEDRAKLREIAEAGVKKVIYAIQRDGLAKEKFDSVNESWSQDELGFSDISLGEGFFTIIGEAYEQTQNVVGSRQEAIVYGAVDEERKININKTSSPQILGRLFQSASGISYEDANRIALAILDWRDEDDHPYDDGAESAYYKTLKPQYVPKNEDLGTLEELLLVKGITQEIYEKTRPFMTLHSNGRINLNTASGVVLKALGISDSLTRKILLIRMGPDGIAGTRDDGYFKDSTSIADTIAKFYAVNDTERASLENFAGSGALTVSSENFSIRSMARLSVHKGARLTVDCVVTRKGGVRSWQEYFSTA
jgi:type II secretory pathway component PulK